MVSVDMLRTLYARAHVTAAAQDSADRAGQKPAAPRLLSGRECSPGVTKKGKRLYTREATPVREVRMDTRGRLMMEAVDAAVSFVITFGALLAVALVL